MRTQFAKEALRTFCANSGGTHRVTATLVAVAAIFCQLQAVHAQGTQPANNSARPQMMPKDADPDWEVVAVKRGDPMATSDHIDSHGRHVRFENETVEIMLLFSYGVQKNQIANAPEWVKTERWDVDGLADVDGEPDVSQLQAMMRKVLAERFAVKLHREQREMPVFALTLAKGGPKLVPNTSDPNGVPNQHGSRGPGWVMYQYKNTSMPELALMLLGWVDRPILDRTNLTGRYDLELKWLTNDSHAADPDAPPALFTAIQEQAGLKLESIRAAAPVLVLDAVERPGAN